MPLTSRFRPASSRKRRKSSKHSPPIAFRTTKLSTISASSKPRETVTAIGGVPLLVRAFRSPGAARLVGGAGASKATGERGLTKPEMVESFVVLNAMGGECFDDFLRLREDAGLK